MGTPALALLEWDLLGCVLEGLGKTLAPGGALDRGLSEKGALCLCSVRYAVAEEELSPILQTSHRDRSYKSYQSIEKSLSRSAVVFSGHSGGPGPSSLLHRAHEVSRRRSSCCRDAAAAVRRPLPA